MTGPPSTGAARAPDDKDHDTTHNNAKANAREETVNLVFSWCQALYSA